MQRSFYILIMILSLSAFTHIWNPIGFPDIFYDEGVYMRRAMHVLNGEGPQETATYYDHPFFGQIFLAVIFKILQFPNYFSNDTSNSVEMLYLVPRILMGIIGVIDTFLIYKISKCRYSRNSATLAALLFAVMPISWFTRRIPLDSILLPFLLCSILLAIRTVQPKRVGVNTVREEKSYLPIVIFSGILLGLAIFTKVTAFTLIPLVGYLIFTSNNRNWKAIGFWFVPVILIPLIWPAYSMAVGDFNYWLNTLLFQTHRENAPLVLNTLNIIAKVDPVLLFLGMAGIIFAVLKRDWFILLWAIPYMLFHYLLNFFPDREFIPILPLFCIAGSVMIVSILRRAHTKYEQVVQIAIFSSIAIFGLTSTVIVINTNLTSSQFETAHFVHMYLQDKDKEVTLVATPIYSWISKYVDQRDNVLSDYRDFLFRQINTDKILLIADQHFNHGKSDKKLGLLYNHTSTIAGFNGTRKNFDTREYPYTSFLLNNEGRNEIEVRIGNHSQLYR